MLQFASSAAVAIHERVNYLRGFFVNAAVDKFGLEAGFAPIGEHVQERLVAFYGWNAKGVGTRTGHQASKCQRLDTVHCSRAVSP